MAAGFSIPFFSHGELLMQIGDTLTNLTVTDLTVQGAGVARVDGRVVFVAGALPGSVVHARVTGLHKGTVQAVRLEECEPSPFAVSPWCPHYEDCGACLWQHFSLEGARQWKTRHVKETLARIGGTGAVDVVPALASPLEKGFRTKMTFAFGPGPGPEFAPQVGLRRRGGKGIVPVTHCGLQGDLTMRILALVRATVATLGLSTWGSGKKGGRGYLRFLVVHTPAFRPEGKSQCLVECITGPDHKALGEKSAHGPTNCEAVRRMGLALVREFGLSGFVHSERRDASDVAQGERIIWSEGESAVTETYGKGALIVPYNAFMQTNTGAASLMYERIAAEAGCTGRERIWDLYSGAGPIALYLADRASEVHGFEIAPSSVEAARTNSVALGMDRCVFHQGAVSPEHLSSLPAPDIIVADPPRSGIEPHIVDALGEIRAKKFIYISCDVATQARDIARLSNAWMPVTSIPVDMFPYTPHVENIVVLNRIAE